MSLFVAEHIWPLRCPTQPLRKRLVLNSVLTMVVYFTAMLLIKPLSAHTLTITQDFTFGLLNWFAMSKSLQFILGFLLMDLTFYYWHFLNHKIPLLWRFHNVHHIDPDLDVTTAMRFHFIEIGYSSLFRLVQLGFLGIDPFTFFCYEIIFQGNTFFHHSNLKLPHQVEKVINKILVTTHARHPSFSIS